VLNTVLNLREEDIERITIFLCAEEPEGEARHLLSRSVSYVRLLELLQGGNQLEKSAYDVVDAARFEGKTDYFISVNGELLKQAVLEKKALLRTTSFGNFITQRLSGSSRRVSPAWSAQATSGLTTPEP